MRLKTTKGSTIARSKYGVGKFIGGNLYLHVNYVTILPLHLQQQVKLAEQVLNNFAFNVVKIGKDSVTFFNSIEFDTISEPIAGEYRVVNLTTLTVKTGKTESIWHHKWLWVLDDYPGFDVQAAFARSKQWLALPNIDFSRIGNKKVWEKYAALL